MTQPTRSQIDAMTRAQAKTWAANNGGKTGAPPGLLQDDSRKLSRALANAPHARQHVREVCAAIARPSTPSPLVGADGETTQGDTQHANQDR